MAFEDAVAPAPSRRGGGLIAPHAGWRFSGSTAWSAMKPIASEDIARIVIFGGHLSGHDAATIMRCDAWSTPARPVEIDREGIDRIAGLHDFHVETDRRYRRDNGVELVLALAAAAWPGARLVAIGVPPTALAVTLGRAVGRAFATEAASTLFIGSTDLTHYGPDYGFAPAGTGAPALEWARKNDRLFIEALTLGAEGDALESAREHFNACCPGAAEAARAACAAARGNEAPATLTHATSSHAVAGGDPVDFVGYAGVIFG